MLRSFCFLPLGLVLIGLAAGPGGLARADETGLTEEYLSDRANIELGQELFQGQCAKCHGRGAYPGKAPKLNARKLTPEDIYLRVTYGFRRMPAWEHVYSDEERMAITAYMKSPNFSN